VLSLEIERNMSSLTLGGSDEYAPTMRHRQMSVASSSSSSSSSSTSSNYSRSSTPTHGPPGRAVEPALFRSSKHILRSNFRYSHADVFVPRRPNLLKAFNDAYRPFKEGQKIPEDALARLEEFTIDVPTFSILVTKREMEKGRYIYLEDGKIKFDTYTQPPHAEVINDVMMQIARQNDNPRLFIGGTAGGSAPLYLLINFIQMLHYKDHASNPMLIGRLDLNFFPILNKS
jgi:hypothetical protein